MSKNIIKKLEDETAETEALRSKVFELERKLLKQGDFEKRLKDTDRKSVV